MSLWDALVLGVVQGATEFLPVSSSGHLVIAQAVLDVSIPGVVFEIAVHLATLVSVLLVYRQRVSKLIVGTLHRDKESWRYLTLLVIATLPAAVIGILWGDQVEALFERPEVVGIALLVTGALLWSTKSALARGPDGFPTVRIAILMGFAQAFALVPGISRSGATVVAGLWLGLGAREAAAFSFLMAIPAISGAAILKAPEMLAMGAGVSTGALAVAGLAAGLTGVLAIRSFVSLLEKQSFHRFAGYCWAVGLAFLAFLSWG